MSDLPLVLSILANVGIAGAAYLGSRQQNETARRAIDAEAARAWEARDEEHLRHRQGVYHEFLDVIRALNPVMVSPKPKADSLVAWRSSYEHRLNAVALFRTAAVQEAVETLHQTIQKFHTDEQGNELTNDRAIFDHFWALQPEIGRVFRAVVAAMRTDVAPRPSAHERKS